MHQSSMKLMRGFRNRYLGCHLSGCTILDVGSAQLPGHRSYRELFDGYDYTGMDVEAGENVDVVGYESLGTYDVVISGQVMEHIARPWEWLKHLEGLYRHYICIIAPNRWGEHRYPIDCYRFLPDGMLALFNYAGIVPLEIRAVGKDTIGIGGKG